MKKATTAELKRINRSNIFQLIYTEQKISKQAIAEKLQLSLPPVTQCLKELEQLQLIEKNGLFESSGGRKPQVIRCIRKSRIAFGVEVLKNRVEIVAADLYGAVLKEERLELPYDDTQSYYRRLGEFVDAFVLSMRVSSKRVLGVGIAVQGLVAADGRSITYSKLLNCAGARLEDFGEFLHSPCRLVHDAEAAALAELWYSRDITDAIYLSLSKNLGGAVILNSGLYKGGGNGSGLIEHMVLEPGGRPCYCGKRGCLEAYCSTTALVGDDRDLETFFAALRLGKTKEAERWSRYLDYLALAIDNLHVLMDCEIILGGHIVPYLTENDLYRLNALLREKNSFPDQREYVRIGKCSHAVVATGAALLFISDFLRSI